MLLIYKKIHRKMNIFRVRHRRIKTEENHALLKVDVFIHIKFF